MGQHSETGQTTPMPLSRRGFLASQISHLQHRQPRVRCAAAGGPWLAAFLCAVCAQFIHFLTEPGDAPIGR